MKRKPKRHINQVKLQKRDRVRITHEGKRKEGVVLRRMPRHHDVLEVLIDNTNITTFVREARCTHIPGESDDIW